MESKLFKKIMAGAYGIGGAIVILGALFKLMHWPGSSFMLILGLGTEALIFIISSFEPLPKAEVDWSLVYPELAEDGMEALPSEKNNKKRDNAEGILSEKIDEMLRASNLDVETIGKLTKSINNFSSLTKSISDSVPVVANAGKYGEQMVSVVENLEKINMMYVSHQNNMSKLESSHMEALASQTEIIGSFSEKSKEAARYMDSFQKNISSLNDIYGGMLSAMTKKQ